MLNRLDPELAAALAALPEEWLVDLHDIPAARITALERSRRLAAQAPPLPAGVTISDAQVPAQGDRPAIPVRLYQPEGVARPAPALLWIHGGGYVMGTVAQEDYRLVPLALQVPCVIVSVDYRLAPEHPYPTPLEDCYAALRWVWDEATALGIDPQRIAIGGASAGGGLTAALALLARDRGEVSVAFQLLIYPMLDDRNQTPSSYEVTDRRLIWTRELNLIGWRAYLGREPGSADVPAYAAPARAEDLTGLPPAYVMVGECDLFRDEDIAYAQRLLQAGVATELHVYPGAFHGFDGFAPQASVSQRARAEIAAALQRAFQGGVRTA
ncbi:alpha/beta hydrolase [Thermorudis peleae]|uniref:alpha/beta hydrolase n=1 Tax=Thermorudis peleae TaxID=1382356 RepID=UPI001E37A6BB|nr:alpha/beta hydrolase [Thermorudis peleae]